MQRYYRCNLGNIAFSFLVFLYFTKGRFCLMERYRGSRSTCTYNRKSTANSARNCYTPPPVVVKTPFGCGTTTKLIQGYPTPKPTIIAPIPLTSEPSGFVDRPSNEPDSKMPIEHLKYIESIKKRKEEKEKTITISVDSKTTVIPLTRSDSTNPVTFVKFDQMRIWSWELGDNECVQSNITFIRQLKAIELF
jgi:hypothetical protein